jgi:hypothetical protein
MGLGVLRSVPESWPVNVNVARVRARKAQRGTLRSATLGAGLSEDWPSASAVDTIARKVEVKMVAVQRVPIRRQHDREDSLIVEPPGEAP